MKRKPARRGDEMKKLTILLAVLLVLGCLTYAQEGKQNKKENPETVAIKKVIEDAYVKGIHINRDIEAVKKGFHPDFTMLMPKDDGIKKVSIQTWIGWIEEGIKKEPNRAKPNVTHKFQFVSATGNAGVAKILIYKDGIHIYSDYMSLYKFSNGWKIVNKIYHTHKKK